MTQTQVVTLEYGFTVELLVDYEDTTNFPTVSVVSVSPTREEAVKATAPVPKKFYRLTLESGEIVEIAVDEFTPAGLPHNHGVVGVMWASAVGGPSRVVKQEPIAELTKPASAQVPVEPPYVPPYEPYKAPEPVEPTV